MPERWSGSWPDNLKLARMADEAGIDFLLPIARWKGYGGDTDYQGATLETLTWASGLLASTSRITVFGTVHAPLFNPVIAAKEMRHRRPHRRTAASDSTSSSAGTRASSRCSASSSASTRTRYDFAQEWLDVVKMIWSPKEDFDFDGHYLKLKGIRAKPKPVGGTRPLIMNAGASPTGRAFAVKNCDAFFMQASRVSIEETAATVQEGQGPRRASTARRSACYSVGVVTCRRTQKEAEEYYQHAIVDNADFSAIDRILGDEEHHAARPRARRSSSASAASTPTAWAACRSSAIADHVAKTLADLSDAGLTGIGDLADQLSRRAAVLPRRGAAAARTHGLAREAAAARDSA